MTSFDYRKIFGVTGNDEWVPGVHRGGQPTPGKPIGIEGAHQPLVGWWDSPKEPYAHWKKNQRENKKKEEVGKGRTPPSKPSWIRFGRGGTPPLGSADPLEGPWTPRQGSPSSPYIYGGFRADLRRLFHGSPTTYLHGFSSRSRFCGADRKSVV